jgi:hypothetical protein
MPLTDLLQWVGVAGKTGTLEIERNKVRKRILMRHGRLIGCGSDDPSDMLGHHLVARGKIGEDTLRAALARQQEDGGPLGEILVGMSAITEDDLLRHLEQKTEESIFGLFEWPDGEFRFEEGAIDEANLIAVDLRVEDVLLRGAQRYDESRKIREVFGDPGIVLARASREAPVEVMRNRMARGILDLVNGERTVAEILLEAHASEFLATKFLYELNRLGVVEIVARKKPRPTPVPAPSVAAAVAEPVRDPGRSPVRAATPQVALAPSAAEVLAGTLETAQRCMDRGDYEAALDLLDGAYKQRPGDDALRQRLVEAEGAFVEKAYRHFLPAVKVPVLARTLESLMAENLSPIEYFLVSRIDGTWDVKSIIQIAPIREIEALRTLKRLREKGLFDLRDPA